MAAKKKQSFEEQLAAVESIIGEMEGGGLTLEAAMSHYEDGVKRVAEMEKELQTMTQRLTVIRQSASGGMEEVPLEEKE